MLYGTALTTSRKHSAGSSPLSTRNFNPEASTSAAPEPPTGVSLTVRGYLWFDIDWGGAGARWKVEWSTDSGSNWSVLADNVTQLGYTHISNLLTPGTTFQYRVIAIDALNAESQPSAVVSGTAVAQSSTNLFTNVSASRRSSTTIDVSADPPAGHIFSALQVYITTNDGNTWQRHGTILAP